MSMDRRTFLKRAAASAAAASAASLLPQTWSLAQTASATRPASAPAGPVGGTSPFTRRVTMAQFPEKTNLILLTDRPPQLETPLKLLRTDITPNEAFFVRWHESAIPTSVDLRTFHLNLAGHVERPVSFSVDELRRQFEPVSFQAVGQCSGNSRGYFQPRVNGGQWGSGAVGNAKWTGVRLRDLLGKAGVKDGAVDVSFAGLDEAPLPDTPKFVKSLTLAKANDPDVIVAYAMNDAYLPMLNGFPLRLVVPGWFATYWVKSLTAIEVLNKPFDGFWMAKAYRIPNNATGNESPQQLATDTVPISRHTCRSIIVSPEPGQRVKAGQATEVEGVALDAGEGIARVEVSTDGGRTWTDAKLDAQAGKYAWRRFRHAWTPAAADHATILSRATNAKGETQTTSLWNRSGYQRNVVDGVSVTVS